MPSNIGEDVLWQQVWKELISATSNADHQFNISAIGNTDGNHRPRLRTVVLRHADADTHTLWFYTDRRSVKAHELRGEGWFSWLFWDSNTQIQFSASGRSHWLGLDETAIIFGKLPKHSRKAYATLERPAQAAGEATSGLPPGWDDLTLEQTDYARNNFGVVETQVTEAEILKLSRDGNIRLSASRGEDEEWIFSWLIP